MQEQRTITMSDAQQLQDKAVMQGRIRELRAIAGMLEVRDDGGAQHRVVTGMVRARLEVYERVHMDLYYNSCP